MSIIPTRHIFLATQTPLEHEQSPYPRPYSHPSTRAGVD